MMLWPILHYFPSRARFGEHCWSSKRDDWFKHYKDVNQLFCNAIVEFIRAGNAVETIWVHDYHLMLLPAMLREKLHDVRIGFFLHVPFPSYEVFRCIPQKQELISGLLGSDLIGFHTFSYTRHFKSAVLRCLGLECTFDEIRIEGRTVRLGIHPIGINWKGFQSAMETEEFHTCLADYTRDFANRRLVVSVSRLDYTKGLLAMLDAIACFLGNMEHDNDITFLIIAVPSRESVDEYFELKERVARVVGELNGKFSRISSPPPVQFIHYSVNMNKLAALYSIADVMLVLPLIDGMNLVAKEYIAVQPDVYDPNSQRRPGVLVLSEFTGASQELYNAQIVNPYDCFGVAETIDKALKTDPKTRLKSNIPMIKRVREQDSTYWAVNFLNNLKSIEYSVESRTVTVSQMVCPFKRSSPGRKGVFIDYDGTLIPIAASPQLAVPTPEVLDLLEKLTSREDLDIYIVSGRSSDFLDQHLGHLNLALISEHGFCMKKAGQSWVELHEGLNFTWKDQIFPYLELYSRTTPGNAMLYLFFT
eukprot:TRINITY_DN702_c0_g1_i1.p1 TRINITY_DN702_c0_g1~~TRINITY_DN702_c0_g1_i1.p1  ORF type:complete len:532 (-),score=34.54 TRINITY_DN702_c0_g1_i1:616-2211(-)